MPGRRVVITGMAVVTSLGSELAAVWKRICAGQSGISQIERFDTTRFKTHFAGEIKNFDPQPYLDSREQKRVDRFAQFALVASGMAIEASGIDFTKENADRCGVILGSGIGGLHEIVDAYERIQQDPNKLSPMVIPRMMVNSAAGHVSIKYGLHGPISAVSTACASSSNAIGDAMRSIRFDEADIMIAGGSEAAITPIGLAGFAAMRALSQRNDHPEEASRPFDRNRDGFVLAEGAGIIVLEEYERAKKRGAKIYAEVMGYGSTSDAVHIAAPDPEGKGAASSMRIAMRDAGVEPEEVQYINAHGTSTPLGDKAETLAIKKVFGDHSKKVMVSSTKSQLGHLLGASGGVECVVSTIAIDEGIVPPTINFQEADPECDLDYVPNEAREAPISIAISNSFGFGGHNASLVIGDPESRQARRAA